MKNIYYYNKQKKCTVSTYLLKFGNWFNFLCEQIDHFFHIDEEYKYFAPNIEEIKYKFCLVQLP